MARTVGDCILMQNIISGPHPLDIAAGKSGGGLELAQNFNPGTKN
jgi:hypothetical protein